MRLRYVPLLAVLLAPAALCSAAPPEGKAPPPGIRLPEAPVVPQPMPPKPQPAPGGVVTLTPDLLYVIDSDVDLLVLSSPEGVVKVTTESGPVKVRGKFVDDPLKVQTKTFKGKWVFTVEAVKSGRAELLVIPIGDGVVLPHDIIRRTLDVDDGTGPIPPPKPKPPEPAPKPKPKPTPATSFRVIFAVESGDGLTPDQHGVVYGLQVEDWLVKHCTGGREGFRRRDKDNPNLAGDLKAVWDAARPLVRKTPCAVVERNGHIEIIDLEAAPAAMLAVFQEYFDGKRGK